MITASVLRFIPTRRGIPDENSHWWAAFAEKQP